MSVCALRIRILVTRNLPSTLCPPSNPIQSDPFKSISGANEYLSDRSNNGDGRTPSRSGSQVNLLDAGPGGQAGQPRRGGVREGVPRSSSVVSGGGGGGGGGQAMAKPSSVNESDITSNPRYKERVLADEHLPSRTVRRQLTAQHPPAFHPRLPVPDCRCVRRAAADEEQLRPTVAVGAPYCADSLQRAAAATAASSLPMPYPRCPLSLPRRVSA